MAKKKSSNRPRKADSGRTLGIALAVAAAGAGAYFLFRPSEAHAATVPVPLPTTSPRGTTPSPSPPRTPTTTAKPAMSESLQTAAVDTEAGAKAFWTLTALYTLDRAAGVPTVANINKLATGGGVSTAAASALTRLGIPSGPLMRPIFDRVRGRRLTLPFVVPTAIWNAVNVVMKDYFNEGDTSLLEPT